ncbi:MAG: hypothetical protein AAGE52_36625 [Myxococcota bacterium]
MKRRPVESVEEHPYPTCGGEPLPEGELIAEGTLQAGPIAREQSILEHFRFERRGCVNVATIRQQWANQASDVEVIFDENWKPIRVWKRMIVPGVPLDEFPPDTRLYELRNNPPTMTMRNEEGFEHRQFNAGVPIAAIGPGRGLISAWIWAQGREMEVGDVVRGPVLDFRQLVERIDEVALRRDPDRYEETMGRTVRVYTVFGRESVFTDEEGVVIGDLSGLRAPEFAEADPPVEVERPPIDSVNTPR